MLDTLISTVDNKSRNFRAISYFIQSSEFRDIYATFSNEQKEILVLTILGGELDQVKRTIKQLSMENGDLSVLTLRELRNMGQRMCIEQYQSKDKQTLIQEIQDVRRNEKRY